jgi:pimeloyl-ACP methyl ester carboxylesterase
VVEPSIEPRTGNPWTWCVGDGEAFVERTAVPELLKEGYHHAWIDLAGCEDRPATMARFRRFLVDELGFAPKAGLIGLGAGGEAAVRYAASSPETADKIYLDNPVLNGAVRDAGRIAAAKIPVMLVYGEADAQAVPTKNAIPFAAALKAAGAAAQTVVRAGWGHFPYGFDVGETKRIVTFFIPEIR